MKPLKLVRSKVVLVVLGSCCLADNASAVRPPA